MRNKQMFVTAMLFGLASSWCNASTPDDMQDRRSKTVNLSDLNFNNPNGVQAAYRRIQGAAETVCQPLEGRAWHLQQQHARCMADAMGKAILVVHHPALMALYIQHTPARFRPAETVSSTNAAPQLSNVVVQR